MRSQAELKRALGIMANVAIVAKSQDAERLRSDASLAYNAIDWAMGGNGSPFNDTLDRLEELVQKAAGEAVRNMIKAMKN